MVRKIRKRFRSWAKILRNAKEKEADPIIKNDVGNAPRRNDGASR